MWVLRAFNRLDTPWGKFRRHDGLLASPVVSSGPENLNND